MIARRSFARWATLSSVAAAAVLAACGGGGSDATSSTPVAGGGGAGGGGGTTTITGVKVTGVAATGAAMANANIHIQCAAGSGNATADANGVYTVTITDGALPCVLTAVSSDNSTELHSVVPGTGAAEATANITPLTELLIAKMAGTDPKSFVTSFNAQTAVSTTQVTAAQTELLQSLKDAGIDTTAVTSVVSGTLQAGTGSGYDGVLDKLKTTIASAGTTLTELTTAVATASSAGSVTTNATLVTTLAPAASDCPGLKSGPLRVMDFSSTYNERVVVDVAAMTVTGANNDVFHLTKNAACDYQLDNAEHTRVLVSRGGVAVMISGTGPTGAIGVAIPEQKLDVAAMAGTYGAVNYDTTPDLDMGDFGTVTFDANGSNTTSMNCHAGYSDAISCTQDNNPQGFIRTNAGGGFDYVDKTNNTVVARAFAYRNPAGRTVMVAQTTEGRVFVFSNVADLALPSVNKSTTFWQFQVDAVNGVGTVGGDTTTITSVDAATSKVGRSFTSTGRTDTLTFNQPFPGMRYRKPGDCKAANGSAVNCGGLVQMPIGGITLSFASVPSTPHSVTVSIEKP